MVGISGKSKGCHACRKKKKACSQERPACRICLNLGKKCPGYQRDWVFRNSTKDWTPNCQSSPDAVGRRAQEEHHMVILSPTSLVTTAYQRLLLADFLQRCQNTPWGWLTVIDERAGVSDALHASALAHCTAKVARMINNKHLAQVSLQAYSRGLRALQTALYDPKHMLQDDTYAACVLLALFEIAHGPKGSYKGYKAHHHGCVTLMRARGAEAHTSELGRAVFSLYRRLGVFEGIINKETFLSEPAWKEIPFRGTVKTLLERLIDLVLDLPPLLAAFDEVRVQQSLAGAISILRHARRLDDTFSTFYHSLESLNSMPLYWESQTSPQRVPIAEPALFTVKFIFPGIDIAALLMLLWASRVVAVAIGLQLHQAIHEYWSRLTPDVAVRNGKEWISELTILSLIPLEPQRDTAIQLARNVCQSVEYLIEYYTSDPRNYAIVAPLRMVLDTLGPWPAFEREANWIQNTFDRFSLRTSPIVLLRGQTPFELK